MAARRRKGGRPAAPPDKREAILAATLELMNERTYDGTPMPLVAQRAGVGAGTIYRYFESKEALANAVYQDCKRVMQQCLVAGGEEEGVARRRARTSSERARAELHGLWRGLFEFLRKHPAACRFLETHQHTSYLDGASRAVSAAVLQHPVDVVRRCQASGAFRAGDPAVLIALAFGAFVGLVKESEAGHFPLDEKTVAASEAAVWDLLRRHPPRVARSTRAE
jgi:AcrR family transcriptional regulator